MGFFHGKHEKVLDKKGRVSIPSDFRAALGEDLDKGIYAFASFGTSANSVQVWPALRMQRLVRKMDEKFDRLSLTQRKIARVVLSRSRRLIVEDTGRIQPTPELLGHAGIAEKIAFVGEGATFAMWEPSAYEAYDRALQAEIEAIPESETEDLLFSIVSGGDDL
ncbi:MAG: hypothetical protein R3F55_15450 [Alphaproteobacteria bacterium]